MFGIVFTYKVAFLPFPAVFITATSEVPTIFLKEAQIKVVSDILAILEKAQKSYKAVIILNEPTSQTHNLNFKGVKNAVVVCCSLRFQGVSEMTDFIEKEIKNQ